MDEDFIDSFNLTLVQGRNFTSNGEAEAGNIIINEAAVKQFGYKDAGSAINSFVLVGKKQYQIIGILKNYHQESLRKEIKPTVYFYGYKWYCDIGFFSTKISSQNIDSTIKNIEKIWQTTFTRDRFEYFFLDDLFDTQYNNERQFGQIYALSTLLAILIAALGLYGLASFSTLNRTKEIGIRKVNGSTALGIMLLLSRDFTKWVVIAFVIACPLSVAIMHNWLGNFAYRTELTWSVFALAGVLAIFIAFCTISIQTWWAATRNPVEALRSE
jgi:putative ABC transport system permease protein